jgi:predicted RNase H-like HicB family nuclease
VVWEWADFTQVRRFGCKVIIARDDGGFVSFAAHLPGAVSQGDTFEDAVAGIREALAGTIASYLEHGEEIPWSEDAVEVHGSDPVSRWIDVDV